MNGLLQIEICVKLSSVVAAAFITIHVLLSEEGECVVDICQQFSNIYAKWWPGAIGRRVQLKFHCDITVAFLIWNTTFLPVLKCWPQKVISA